MTNKTNFVKVQKKYPKDVLSYYDELMLKQLSVHNYRAISRGLIIK